ncbi:MAG: family 78 glycoside hydrolase catalytic domain [Roseburia sp.]
MYISRLRVNHKKNPLGFNLAKIHLSWEVKAVCGKWAVETRIIVSESSNMEKLVYDSGVQENYHENQMLVSFDLKPRTRYYWQVEVKDDKGDCAKSNPAWFETGKLQESWTAKWIGTEENEKRMPLLYKEFELKEKPESVRWHVCGLGLYEAYVNEKKAGREFLMPGYHCYDSFLEYQTLDVTELLSQGKNKIAVLLGEGWYKGRFGFDGDYRNLYGNQKKCIGELHIRYANGQEECIVTDSSWKAEESSICENGIYDGEHIDETLEHKMLSVEEIEETRPLVERFNPRIHKVEEFQPVSVKQEDEALLLDFGETVTGWVEITGAFETGQKVMMQYGEVLQKGRFYRDNLRTAKAEFTYVSKGKGETIRPHFTYYGFRYVKIKGLNPEKEYKYTAYRIMSDIERTGWVATDHDKVNHLLENTLRSQKCNFLDIPTDCPQRDERMGWTGDAGIFASTACFHMDSGSFFHHYMKNMQAEQEKCNGAIPFFVPRPKVKKEEHTNPFYLDSGAAVWGDAATLIPWKLYQFYGDKAMLEEQYPVMKAWVDYEYERTKENEIPYLWQNDRQLGDWLALDNGNINNPIGKTDSGFIASVYHYWSTKMVKEAAESLGLEESKVYAEREKEIRNAILNYYFPDKKFCLEYTQTACALLLYLKLYPEGEREVITAKLAELLKKNNGHLNTGFVGTPILCMALSENGQNQLAYDLLLNEDYPGWLHEVNLGATTVWERWNSLEEDGSISGTGMNSLNHYAYGSIAEWIYRYMCGLNPSIEEAVKMTIYPMPDQRLKKAEGSWRSVFGKYVCAWNWKSEQEVVCNIEVPFNANARFILPDGTEEILDCGKYEKILNMRP